MPYTGKSFASKHNHAMKANPAVATKAAKMANAMEKAGVDPGIAIATASKRAPGAVAKEQRAAGASFKEHAQRRPYA